MDPRFDTPPFCRLCGIHTDHPSGFCSTVEGLGVGCQEALDACTDQEAEADPDVAIARIQWRAWQAAEQAREEAFERRHEFAGDLFYRGGEV